MAAILPVKMKEENDMTEVKEKEIRVTPEATVEQPMLTMRLGRTNFLIGLHFAESGKETLEDKVIRLINRDVQNDNF